MSSSTWTPRAVSSEARAWSAHAWRVVEAQHAASTMKLVDDADEQALLESLLEEAKPALPAAAASLHYLLATPFRYPSARGGSRFRAAVDPGVWYGAQTVRTACAELGYWRWKFVCDALDLARLDPVAHTAFRAGLATQAVDLRAPPFDAAAPAWTHRSDYTGTQAFARAAREAGVGAIVYASVRDSQPAWCVAVLSATAFSARRPHAGTQTWWLSVDRARVRWQRDGEAFTFEAAGWAAPGAAAAPQTSSSR